MPLGEPLRVGLVGAGRGGTALLHLFALLPMVRVVAVADPDPEAPGVALARAQGIPVVGAHREIFAHAPQIVVEVTGRLDVREDLLQAKPVDVELIGAQSARLFWDLLTARTRETQVFERTETIRRMTGGIFHSLNNLFMILLGRSRLLLRSVEGERWTPAELTAGLRTIADAVTRGSETLKRLRALTRESPDEGVSRLDVNALVREVVASSEPLIHEASACSVAVALADVPPVLGRPSELREVLVNLVVNAMQAMPGGGVLTLTTMREGTDVVIRVRDTGVGIPDDVQGRLFTPFFTTKAQGTGLGLSLSREIVRRHGGDLEVESAGGEGTCFTMRLPVAGGAVAEQQAIAPDLQARRILVVDDDPLFRDLLVEMLATAGYQEVRAAAGGEEALAALADEPYDLVLTDIVMPNITGWQVAQAARAQHPATAVILFSGWGIEPNDPVLAEIRADAFLEKPLRMPELLETVQSVLRRTGRSGE